MELIVFRRLQIEDQIVLTLYLSFLNQEVRDNRELISQNFTSLPLIQLPVLGYSDPQAVEVLALR